MPMTIEQLYNEAVTLSNESKAILADKLVESIDQNIDDTVTRIHLAEVKRRRDDIRSGKVVPVDGDEGLVMVRTILNR